MNLVGLQKSFLRGECDCLEMDISFSSYLISAKIGAYAAGGSNFSPARFVSMLKVLTLGAGVKEDIWGKVLSALPISKEDDCWWRYSSKFGGNGIDGF